MHGVLLDGMVRGQNNAPLARAVMVRFVDSSVL